MAFIDNLKVKVDIEYGISLWQAIKLRISGLYKSPEFKIKIIELLKEVK